MKILFVIPSIASGGQEKAGMILTNYLSAYHDVQIVCLEPASMGDFGYKSPVHRITVNRAQSKAGKIIVVLKRIKALRKLKAAWKPDVSIAIGPTAMIINSLSFGSEQKISSIRQSLSKLKENWLFNKILFSVSGKIVPVHNGINKELWNIYKIKNHQFAFNGYDIKKITEDASEPLEKELIQFFNANVLAHMGRFDVPKCHWQLVKIFHLLRNKIPALKLILIGDVDISNPINKEIYEFCISYLRSNGYKIRGIGEQTVEDIENYDVLMLGHTMNPHKYLAKSDLFIFPSAWEGFPNSLVEAMACGLPVVCADCPTGPKEILINENTGESHGILMPVFDHNFDPKNDSISELHQQWADAILQLMADKNKLQYYKLQSIKRSNDFSVEKSCKKWLAIIENKPV